MAGPPFLPGGVPETEGFRRPGAPEKKICRGAPEGKETEESSEALGHQSEKYVMVPRKERKQRKAPRPWGTREGNMSWCPGNFAGRGISRKIARRCPQRP